MASETVLGGNFLQAVAQQAKAMKGLPPVASWNPPYCGEIDLVIRRDGSWTYLGTPIGRPAMVRLFSTILRREEDGSYGLVTPAERVGIRVEDAPFLAVLMAAEGEGREQRLRFTTTVADEGDRRLGPPVCVSRPLPGPARSRLTSWCGTGSRRGSIALSIYDLVALGVHETIEISSPARGGARTQRKMFGVWSSGVFFPMIESEALA